jgi:site-specific recombinase XerD
MSDVDQFNAICSPQGPVKSDVISFLTLLTQNEYTKSSISRKMSSLRLYLNFLKQKKNRNVPSLDGVFSPKITVKLPKIMTEERLSQVLRFEFKHSKYPARNQALIALLYYAGCRVSEVVALKKNNVFSKHIIIFGKGGKERLVPLAHGLLHKLNHHLGIQGDSTKSPWVFPGRGGRPITRQTVSGVLRELTQQLGITERITPHMLRHMFATTLLDRGMDLREVQLLLGHSAITTTQIYTHVSQTKLRHVYNACHPLS